jgi:hypothetical protein
MVGDTEVEKTFHGARICKGNKTVNECVSMSFDPRNYVCIGCKVHHKIGEKGPLVICFADQNMVPFITDGEGNCMAIVRLENASLADLIDISFEILEKLAPPPGSVILYGSASHLYRVGASIYTKEWVAGRSHKGGCKVAQSQCVSATAFYQRHFGPAISGGGVISHARQYHCLLRV